MAKQFNKTVDFPLPGQTGVLLEGKKENKIKVLAQQPKQQEGVVQENLNFLFNKPLPIQNQAIKIQDACRAVYMKEKMEESLLNLDKNLFELKAFKCPASLVQDFQNYFRSCSIDEKSLTILTISFKTENDMATWNKQVDSEREVLMNKFVNTAQQLCSIFKTQGAWADFIDPSSGRPVSFLFNRVLNYQNIYFLVSKPIFSCDFLRNRRTIP